MEELVRQECREYMDQQVKKIKQELEQKLANDNQKDVLKHSVNGDGPISNTKKLAQLYQKPEELPKPNILMARDSDVDNRKSVVSWSTPEFGGKTGRCPTFGSQIVQIPEELQHLDWSQARMAGNWKASEAEGVVLMQELCPPLVQGQIGEEVTEESKIVASGLGSDNDALPPPVIRTDGKLVPTKEKITIAQTDKKVIPNRGNNIDATSQRLSSSLSEPRMFYPTPVEAQMAETNENKQLRRNVTTDKVTTEKIRVNEVNKKVMFDNTWRN